MSEIGTFTPTVNRQLPKPVDKLIAVLKEEVQLGNTVGLVGQNSCSFILSENADRQTASNAQVCGNLLMDYWEPYVHVTYPSKFSTVKDLDSADWVAASIQRNLNEDGHFGQLYDFLWTNSLDSCLRRINTKAFDTWPDVDDSFHTERAKSYPAIQTFSKGLKGVCPDPGVTDMAIRITAAALAKTVEPEITVDVDGALSFDLRLASGLLILAELDLFGELDASVYDDREGILVRRLPQTTESELIGLF